MMKMMMINLSPYVMQSIYYLHTRARPGNRSDRSAEKQKMAEQKGKYVEAYRMKTDRRAPIATR